MTPDSGLEMYMLVTAIATIGAGLYGIFRSVEIAGRNQARIDGGKEAYFEERRSWRHYGRPSIDPRSIRRAGWTAIAGGVALLLTHSPISIFHWS